jgi:indolepyruvate ferredoxin oxidoreductase beta subunit
MKAFNIHLTGVGGQGIGLLSEALLRASDHAGHRVKGVDTHGLAQRGGVVTSRIRLGEGVHSPLIGRRRADLVVSLERHEAGRSAREALKDGGTLAYYDTSWQPMEVRIGGAEPFSSQDLQAEADLRGIQVVRVFKPGLVDARQQNMVLLAHIVKRELVPGVGREHVRQALDDLMAGRMLQENLALVEAEWA